MDDEKIRHLEVLREDARDEIKRRIEQRDKYSIQFTIALSAAIAVAFFADLPKVLIVAPLLSIYFTVLILYSYRMHELLAWYLRKKIEPELARLCGTPLKWEWETFCELHKVIAVRKIFFIIMPWVVCFASLLYLWRTQDEEEFRIILGIITVFYFSVILVITIVFSKKR